MQGRLETKQHLQFSTKSIVGNPQQKVCVLVMPSAFGSHQVVELDALEARRQGTTTSCCKERRLEVMTQRALTGERFKVLRASLEGA